MKPQSSDQDKWSPFILSSLSKGRNDILHLELRHLRLNHTKTTHLKSLPTISHHYELLPLNPTMKQEYYKLYKELLSSKSKVPGRSFRDIMLNTIVDVDLEDHKGRSTQDNSST
ncbi:hypothetical protein O181_045921 [Austropuccinia psidii MF-1]|uniref:Uncharacterized protein n=1 Tax=Austropuccinia psidii MF-1 TaxID=1389203 RepID=A0A9Q3DL19_9BASI|nr:hypothetical protein [Austropuccinia psidii MF-1]